MFRGIGKIGLRRTLKLEIGAQTSFMPLKKLSTTTSWNQMDHSKGTNRFLIMDSPILQDILWSNLPEELKCLNLAMATKDLEYITAADCYGLFKVYVQWVLHFDEQSKVWRPAFDSLEFLAQSAPMLFTKFVRPNLVNDIVMYYPNYDKALELCEWLFIIQWRVELTEKYKDTTRKNEEKYKYATSIAAMALDSAHAMHYTDALYIMHTMADIFLQQLYVILQLLILSYNNLSTHQICLQGVILKLLKK